jgi:hypothetical protein
LSPFIFGAYLPRPRRPNPERTLSVSADADRTDDGLSRAPKPALTKSPLPGTA